MAGKQKQKREDDFFTMAVEYIVGSEEPRSLPARRRLDAWNAQPAEQRDTAEGEQLLREWQHGRPKEDPGDATRGGASMASARRRGAKPNRFVGLELPSERGPKPRPAVQVRKAGAAEEGSMRERLSAATRPAIDPAALRRVASISPLVAQHLSGEPEGDDLSRARAQEREGTMGARIARAGAMFNEAVSGAKYERPAYDDLERSASQPVEDLLLRRKMGAEDRDFSYRQERDRADDELRERDMDLRAGDRAADNQYRLDMLREQRHGNALRAQAMRQEQEDKSAERKLRGRQRDIQELGQRMAKSPFGELQKSLTAIDELAPGIIYGQTPSDDPLGFGDQLARRVPGGAGERFMGDKAKRYASEISNLRDLISRMRSGAVLNASEEAHYNRLLGDEVLSDLGKAAYGINAVREGLSQKLRDIQVPYEAIREREGPSVLDDYESFGGTSYRHRVFSGKPRAAEPTPTGEVIDMPDGSKFMVMSNGKARPMAGGGAP